MNKGTHKVMYIMCMHRRLLMLVWVHETKAIWNDSFSAVIWFNSRCLLTLFISMICKRMKENFCLLFLGSVQFSSVAQSCLTLCDPVNRSTPALPVLHQLPKFTQTHVHWFGDAIQPSHPLLSPSPPAPNPSQHQGLFQWVNSSHEVAKVLEVQLQHQYFQWTPRTDLL